MADSGHYCEITLVANFMNNQTMNNKKKFQVQTIQEF